MSGLHNLEVFRVNSNSLIGNVPTSLFTIPSLRLVSLSENQLEGPLEFGNTSLASELPYLDLASNNFNGPISESISRFLKLEFIDLSNNSFTGPIPGSMSKLVSLDDLNLSYNKLEGQVPSFLWRMSTLMLSHNSFSSFEELSQAVVNGSDSDHGSNSFQGPVQFDLGSNSLHGSLPRWICKRTSLALLDLSNNHLTGSIPSCLMNCTASLGYIILRNNNLSGFLPDIFTNATKLRSLDVSRNQLSGKLPKSLINCESMEYLNLKSLRVIDLSNNSFNGTLPQDYFVNWREMASVGEKDGFTSSDGIDTFMEHMGGGIYEDSMDMMYKGVDTEFPLILLMFKAIDFSGNKFTGRIPKSIGMLKELRHVNFSRNAFTGSIPSSLANIKNLEALDLSHNKLSGNIPRDLANLSFVSYLDFSHNLLQGPVPRSTQFQRQHCSSFEDNLGLFGLEDICGPVHATSGDSDQSEEFSSEEAEEALSWKAAAIAFGPGVFCGLVIGYIFFTSHKQTHMVHGKARLNHPGGIISVR
ncbi:receptor-like protein 30 [Brassica napus]|uniref:receptor-like protein 30 n=1 Tax=Brassica napus TaxID=3708 RepID=UPI0020786401|nr:receptor-like protein 30 [Brassica napus]